MGFDIDQLNESFEEREPWQILQWAWKQFGPRIAATSSFQTQSMPLLYMIAEAVPELPIFFLDTGFHFPETLAFRDQLISQWHLNVRTLKPVASANRLVHRNGTLFRTDPDMCCYLNKVEPLEAARQELDAWITGIRRDQTPERQKTPILTRQQNGQIKVCPMATWTSRDIWSYINQHDLPTHPLLKKGYMSIGCAPCTQPVSEDQDEREGRWSGQSKTECGIHIPLFDTPATATPAEAAPLSPHTSPRKPNAQAEDQ